MENLTRGPWATSLTWENSSNHLTKYDYIITLIKRRKKKNLREIIGSSFEEICIPFTQGCFVPSLVEIGSVVLAKRIFQFHQCLFSLFQNYIPLEKWRCPSFEQTWIPFTQGCFVPSLAEIGPVVLEKMKMWKIYRLTDGQADRRLGLSWILSMKKVAAFTNAD